MESVCLYPAQGPFQAEPCIHCGSALEPGQLRFCCRGCETVYGILHSRGLGEYYRIKSQGGALTGKSRPAPRLLDAHETYSYLDDPEFRKLYGDGDWMQFYLEGIHCAACIWLIERLPQALPGLKTIRLDVSRSIATVSVDPGTRFSAIARELHQLGYRPHAVKNGEVDRLQRLENRKLLIQLAVSGACTGNLMLMAIPLYAGVSGALAEVFRWVSLGLFLPVLIYSARPFYKNAWTAVRAGSVSIDIPIVLGILLGFVASALNLLSGSEHIYFDSLAALVFLLLSSRYVLRRTQQSALSSSSLLHFLTPSSVRKKTGEVFEETSLEFIRAGDEVEVRVGEPIPVDGRVTRGQSMLNCSLLTGESDWVSVQEGSAVFAGTVNQQAPLEIRVSASGAATRLGKILKATEEGLARKAPIVALADRAARIFVWGTLALSSAVFFFGLGSLGWQEALNRSLAVVIVTCPCALAIATPLAMTVFMGKAAHAGILIKGSDVIEKLSHARTVFLDKTGTLTTGNFEVVNVHWEKGADPDGIAPKIVALESRSTHPIANALVRYFRRIPTAGLSLLPEIEGFREVVGQGVSGKLKPSGEFVEIRQWVGLGGSEGGTEVAFYSDGRILARIQLGDRLRSDSKEAVKKLRTLGIRPWILSGDNESAVRRVAGELDIGTEYALARLTPEAKSARIAEEPRAVMVGDGANDAVALASADVGVAVHGGMEVSLRAADVFLAEPGVMPITRMLIGARETMKVVRRNLAFSAVYNLLGIAAALTGKVDPLFAAVLMPLSAFTVFGSSVLGTRKLRREGL